MAFRDISSKIAVTKAVSEFDEIGRDAFLSKYGFGPATSYFLTQDSKLYDSKAILGAAHGYQFGTPLRADEFYGGDSTVARKLKTLGFDVISVDASTTSGDRPAGPARNPNWSRDELIITLDFYMDCKGDSPDQKSEPIAELSEALRTLHETVGASENQKLRNPNGVYMKLMNFRRFDPRFSAGAYLERGGKLEAEVWEQFANAPEVLKATASAIRSGVRFLAAAEGGSVEMPDDLAGLEEADEGRVLSVMHLRRERSAKLAKAKKDSVFRATGKMACETCSFDFAAAYGERGQGFIECHHRTPLTSLPGSTKTPLADLALLCANCHRMVHVRRPWLTLDELRKIAHGGQRG